MKKKIFVLAMIVTVLLTGCGGSVWSTKKIVGESSLYSKSEIRSAMNVVTQHFAREFDGCVLLELRYDEEKTLAEQARNEERGESGDVLVLSSVFWVDATGGDGSMEPSSTYEGWTWELRRSGIGGWKLTNWGYG